MELPVKKDAQAVSGATQSSKNRDSIGMILVSVFLGGVGQLIFKAAMNNVGELSLSLDMLLSLATNLLFLVGLAVYGASTLLWLIALMRAELSFAYPFLSLAYITVLFGGALFFSEQITLPRVLGFVVIIAGIIIVARGESTSES